MSNLMPSYVLMSLFANHADLSAFTVGVGHEPDTPDLRITCIDTGGESPHPSLLLDYPTVQVVVRSTTTDYALGWDTAKLIKDLCLGIPAQAVGSQWLAGVTLLSDVTYAGKDESQRLKFTLNFNLYLEPATNANTHREAL